MTGLNFNTVSHYTSRNISSSDSTNVHPIHAHVSITVVVRTGRATKYMYSTPTYLKATQNRTMKPTRFWQQTTWSRDVNKLVMHCNETSRQLPLQLSPYVKNRIRTTPAPKNIAFWRGYARTATLRWMHTFSVNQCPSTYTRVDSLSYTWRCG